MWICFQTAALHSFKDLEKIRFRSNGWKWSATWTVDSIIFAHIKKVNYPLIDWKSNEQIKTKSLIGIFNLPLSRKMVPFFGNDPSLARHSSPFTICNLPKVGFGDSKNDVIRQ